MPKYDKNKPPKSYRQMLDDAVEKSARAAEIAKQKQEGRAKAHERADNKFFREVKKGPDWQYPEQFIRHLFEKYPEVPVQVAPVITSVPAGKPEAHALPAPVRVKGVLGGLLGGRFSTPKIIPAPVQGPTNNPNGPTLAEPPNPLMDDETFARYVWPTEDKPPKPGTPEEKLYMKAMHTSREKQKQKRIEEQRRALYAQDTRTPEERRYPLKPPAPWDQKAGEEYQQQVNQQHQDFLKEHPDQVKYIHGRGTRAIEAPAAYVAPLQKYTEEEYLASPQYKEAVEAERRKYAHQAEQHKQMQTAELNNAKKALAEERESDPNQRAIRALQAQQMQQLGPLQQTYIQHLNQQSAMGHQLPLAMLQGLQQAGDTPPPMQSSRQRRNLYAEMLAQLSPERFNPDYYPEEEGEI